SRPNTQHLHGGLSPGMLRREVDAGSNRLNRPNNANGLPSRFRSIIVERAFTREDPGMLVLGRQPGVAASLSRRGFLQAGGSAVLGLSLAALLRLRARGGDGPGSARSVLLLWLWGGPAHLDTFDPKPAAPIEYRGPFAPIATKVTGLRIGELFPR